MSVSQHLSLGVGVAVVSTLCICQSNCGERKSWWPDVRAQRYRLRIGVTHMTFAPTDGTAIFYLSDWFNSFQLKSITRLSSTDFGILNTSIGRTQSAVEVAESITITSAFDTAYQWKKIALKRWWPLMSKCRLRYRVKREGGIIISWNVNSQWKWKYTVKMQWKKWLAINKPEMWARLVSSVAAVQIVLYNTRLLSTAWMPHRGRRLCSICCALIFSTYYNPRILSNENLGFQISRTWPWFRKNMPLVVRNWLVNVRFFLRNPRQIVCNWRIFPPLPLPSP